MQSHRWELRHVMLMAMLGTVFAVVYLGTLYGGLALRTLLTPIGLAPFGIEIVFGVWFMAATVAAYVIRRPGAALITEVLAALIELLLGNAGGGMLLIAAVLQGLGCEVGFAVFRYRRYDLVSMSLAGVLGAIFIFTFEYFYHNYALLAPLLLVSQLLVRCLSAVVFSGVLAKRISDSVANTGALKAFPIGMRQRSQSA